MLNSVFSGLGGNNNNIIIIKYITECNEKIRSNNKLNGKMTGTEKKNIFNEIGVKLKQKLFDRLEIYIILSLRQENILSKSNVCRESAIKIFGKINMDQLSALENLSSTSGSFSYNEITSMKKMGQFFESDECKAKLVTSNANYNVKNDNSVRQENRGPIQPIEITSSIAINV
ncbi:hypothetical protein BCR32DRAFT_285960 [Anaeromyces robustus]|uniref:Uncharacterized protein n=1 Tax=Anaeromyces robustus TaxID=1754192 RepID=A0A1Y1WB48_9FUNG|nr:hypothetical protein BCR32DRAFT_285960 [Anaeromyces robustus]|eukprot:ORX70384.1 hypothetical protein BCR32DRAFT_285960 [Anaeromyces robustus]